MPTTQGGGLPGFCRLDGGQEDALLHICRVIVSTYVVMEHLTGDGSASSRRDWPA